MTFSQNIEQWRLTVNEVISDLTTENPERNTLILASGLTIGTLADTILAIVEKESSGDSQAVGDKQSDGSYNSLGLMQLNFGAGTPQSLGFKGSRQDLLDPYTNIFYGTSDFLKQLDRYQDVDKAILAYNAGSYLLNKSGSPVNQSYLDSVLSELGEKKTTFLRGSPSQPVSGTGSQKNLVVKCSTCPVEQRIVTEPKNLPGVYPTNLKVIGWNVIAGNWQCPFCLAEKGPPWLQLLIGASTLFGGVAIYWITHH